VSELTYYELPAERREEVLRAIATRLAEDVNIVFAYAHGSFVRRRFFRDVDVAVWLRDPSDPLRYVLNLSAELDAKVGLPVDVQVLNEAPLPFKYRVVTEGRLLLSRDERLRRELVNAIVRERIDFQLLCELYGRRSKRC
jgi:predicted nucleotidyltransferase